MLSPENVSQVHSSEVQATLDAIVRSTPTHISVAQEQGRDPVYVVPLHQSADRFETIKTTVRSIAAQRQRNDAATPTMILADNGVTEHDIRGVVAHMQTSGIDVRVVDAQPRMPTEKNAAHARNQALNYIGTVREQEEGLRGPIALLDSDSAFIENDAVMRLQETLQKHPHAQSVNGVVELVQDVEKAYTHKDQRKVDGSQNEQRVLPSLWKPDGTADLAAIVAFSSQIAGKTTGQLMHAGAVGPHNAYVQMPNGSAEDMIAALYQSRKGEIYVNEQVHIIDQDRPNPGASLQQQMQWGEDHVYLQNALAQVGAQRAGILVLEPTEQGWAEWVAAGTEDTSGVVVNPAQLRRLLFDLHTQVVKEYPKIQDESFLQLESTRLANVLTILEERRAKSNIIIRTDLPHYLDEARKDGRYSDVAQAGRLLGNMAGVHALHACENAFAIPHTFLYGMRQRACW